MKVLLNIMYDGTNFFGWQKQQDKRTVQHEIEKALKSLFKKDIPIRGASRTDAKVHALDQLAVFKHDFNIPMQKLPFAINSFLPKDIVITNATIVPDDFHPQKNVYKKTYIYKIYNNSFNNPLLINYAEFINKKLDIKKMQDACKYFIGEYDFKAFCATKSYAKTTIRTIYNLNIENKENFITIKITGNGFLYNMVRIITGTLIDIGMQKKPPSCIKEIINSKNRANAGATASAKGLYLYKIYYTC